MKTFINKISLIALLIIGAPSFATTIAVAPLKTFGVFTSPEVAAQLARIELVKLEKFAVLDRFDMAEVANPNEDGECYSKECLIDFGTKLGVDLIMSGSVDKLGNKIVVNLKLININSGELQKNQSCEFDDQESELGRMFQITLQKMFELPVDPELEKRLTFNNDPVTSNDIGRINNSGPRMGGAYVYGDLNEFFTRDEDWGGLGIQPITTNIGYQFEVQYVGTEKFSALFEFIPTFTGLEQGQFIPSVSVLNGFRWGKSGWEFAFGPGLGISKSSRGFFDSNGIYGPENKFWSEKEFISAGHQTASIEENEYETSRILDKNGDLRFSTRWILAAGRTFRFGALNVPVNVFWSSQKGGGMIGSSIGFNIIRQKKEINSNY